VKNNDPDCPDCSGAADCEDISRGDG
jgi:hypothetical protein